ncbi:cytochrome b-c1 complex subunit 9 [Diaporthe eres]|nr:cytochrome b-c1 complex subunit 9 [Diaporthe eres]
MILAKGIIGMSPPILMSTSQLHLFGSNAPERRIANSHRPLATPALSFNVLFRSNYAMLGAIFAGAFAFNIAYDVTTTKVWDNMNRGRQWKDIKQKYLQGAEEEE